MVGRYWNIITFCGDSVFIRFTYSASDRIRFILNSAQSLHSYYNFLSEFTISPTRTGNRHVFYVKKKKNKMSKTCIYSKKKKGGEG